MASHIITIVNTQPIDNRLKTIQLTQSPTGTNLLLTATTAPISYLYDLQTTKIYRIMQTNISRWVIMNRETNTIIIRQVNDTVKQWLELYQ
jgi:hypothetical protein